MQVKFESKEYRWLAVREKPDKSSSMIRMIETGTGFDVEPGTVDDEKGNPWYYVTNEPNGYVMAEFVEDVDLPIYSDGNLGSMKVSELRKLAKDSGVTLKAGMSKGQIIEAILNG